jgi:hypothetical protein
VSPTEGGEEQQRLHHPAVSTDGWGQFAAAQDDVDDEHRGGGLANRPSGRAPLAQPGSVKEADGNLRETSPSAPSTKVQNNTASRITEPHEGVDR